MTVARGVLAEVRRDLSLLNNGLGDKRNRELMATNDIWVLLPLELF